MELVTSPGSLGATASASFLLAATTTALPTWARWLGEKISFSFPVVDAWTARSASSSTYWSVGRASSFLWASWNASSMTSCLAASTALRHSIWAVDAMRSSRSAAAFRPWARTSSPAALASAWAWAVISAALALASARMALISFWLSSWMRAVIFSIPFICLVYRLSLLVWYKPMLTPRS